MNRSSSSSPSRGWLLVLLTLAFIRGMIYASIIPPWQAPDEIGHFEYSLAIAHEGGPPDEYSLPSQLERKLIGSLYEWQYLTPGQMPDRLWFTTSRTLPTHRFSPAYALFAVPIWLLSGQDLSLQLFAVRTEVVLINVLIVWLAWRILNLVLPRSPEVATAATCFIIFLPQHTYINAMVNENVLAELCANVAIYGWVRLFGKESRVWHAVLVIAGTTLAVWAKTTAVYLLLLGGLLLVAQVVIRRKESTKPLSVRRIALIVLLVVAVLAAFSSTEAARRLLSVIELWVSSPGLATGQASSQPLPTVWYLFQSFWAVFGASPVRVGWAFYSLTFILTIVAAGGWILRRHNGAAADYWGQRVLTVAALVAVSGLLVLIFVLPFGPRVNQGRYLFPIAVPLAYLLVSGWARWLPERFKPLLVPATVIIMAGLDTAALCLTIWPHYYG